LIPALELPACEHDRQGGSLGLRTLMRVWQLADWVIWQIAIINAISLLRCP
jgi:hypothetical protein